MEEKGEFVKELARDFTECPKCGCDEALVIAIGIGENVGRAKIFCPVCVKGYLVKDISVPTDVEPAQVAYGRVTQWEEKWEILEEYEISEPETAGG